MDKILKTIDYKIQLREKEIIDEDGIKEEKQQKEITIAEKKPYFDPFFAKEGEEAEDAEEKRVVQRDGYVPKLQKTIERIKKEKDEKQKKWEQKQIEKQWAKPLKINPKNYRVQKSKIENKDNDSKPKNHHVFL